MKPIKYILLAVLTSFIFYACEDIIQVDINDEEIDVLAIDARISTNDNPFVYITRALKITDASDYSGVSNARVMMVSNGVNWDTLYMVENDTFPGFYEVPTGTTFLGEEMATYELTIMVDNDTIRATEFLDSVSTIDSIVVRPSDRGEYRFLALLVNSPESESDSDYYAWDIYVNDTLLYGMDQFVFASDEGIREYVADFEMFTDFVEKANERVMDTNDVVFVEQRSISKPVFDFYTAILNQEFAGFLFSVPPANAPSNFTSAKGNKVFGVFTAQDVSVSNEVIITEELMNSLKPL